MGGRCAVINIRLHSVAIWLNRSFLFFYHKFEVRMQLASRRVVVALVEVVVVFEVAVIEFVDEK